MSGQGQRAAGAAGVEEGSVSKWLVAVTVMSGAFMVVLDTTVVNVALPKIMAGFGVNLDKIQWVVTAYMLAMAIMMPSVGWLSARIGNKALFICSLALFALASAFCGTAWNEDALIFFRTLQGLGAGALMPIAMVIIFEAFPPEQRGLAMGVYGIGATLGPAIGPTLGGYLTEHFSWHLIFYINVPVGLTGVFLAAAILPRGKTRAGMTFDLWGFATMAASLACLLIAFSQGQREGWTSGYILTLFSLAGVGLLTFLWVEARVVSRPFIDLSVYGSFTYGMATLVFVIQGIGLFGSTFLIPMFFERLLDYTALQTGILLLPMALMVSLVLPTAGRLADRIDGRILIAVGVLFSTLSLYWLSFLDLRTSASTAMFMLILRGFGIGFIFPPLMNIALNSLPPEKVATGSGLMNVSRQVGGAFGVAALEALLDRREIFHNSLFAQAQQLNSVGTTEFLNRFQGLFESMGAVESAARGKALAVLNLLVGKQASVSAFDDCFFVAACIFLIGLLPTVLLRVSRK
jgi:DHA2 family multidrug resistance protein